MRIWSKQLNAKLLGTRIREARERLGISQDQLAELVSKDQAAISAYELGKRKIAAVDLPLFARVLKVSILDLYEGETSLDDLDRAIGEFHRLPTAESKRSIIDVVRNLCETISMHYRS